MTPPSFNYISSILNHEDRFLNAVTGKWVKLLRERAVGSI
jgi:hypothetical protein